MNILFPLLIILCLLSSAIPIEAKQNKSFYKYQLAVCAMFQDEAQWLKEWIEYHKLIGVDHFYLFDNGSTDHYLDVLYPYILSGEVELYQHPQVGQNQQEYLVIQKHLINKSIKLAENKARWLAIIDLDEYIVPIQNVSLPKILEKYEKFGGVYANWLMFGTSHIEKIPYGVLMLEALNHCAAKPTVVGKSIVRPERVKECTSPHYMIYKEPYHQVNTNKNQFEKTHCPIAIDQILIFHYYTRDLNHLLNVKIPRRAKWMTINDTEQYLQQMEALNQTVNVTMHRFIPLLKQKLNFF